MDKKFNAKIIILIIVAVLILAGAGILIVSLTNNNTQLAGIKNVAESEGMEENGITKGENINIQRVISEQEFLNIAVENDLRIDVLEEQNSDIAEKYRNYKVLRGVSMSKNNNVKEDSYSTHHFDNYGIIYLYCEDETSAKAVYNMAIWNMERGTYTRKIEDESSNDNYFYESSQKDSSLSSVPPNITYDIEQAKRTYNSTDRYDHHKFIFEKEEYNAYGDYEFYRVDNVVYGLLITDKDYKIEAESLFNRIVTGAV
ncbi:MAG: hypothetical protein ACI4GV_01780 [Acutalibacteraceae bacterium]